MTNEPEPTVDELRRMLQRLHSSMNQIEAQVAELVGMYYAMAGDAADACQALERLAQTEEE